MSDRWLPVSPPGIRSLTLSPEADDVWVVVNGDLPGGAMLRLPPDRVLVVLAPIKEGERFRVDGDRVVPVTS